MKINSSSSRPIVFAVSDSIGETAELVIRAAMIQFNSGHINIKRIPYVTDIEYVEEVIEEAKAESKCAIVCTIVLPEVRQKLIELAHKNNIPIVDLMGPMMDTLSKVTELKPRLEPGLVHKIDEDYFKKVEALEFAVQYDDGKDPRGFAKADVILIGVSRTSKTPLALYLAHNRLKVANLPLVPEMIIPDELFQVPAKKIVGLTISKEKLYEIRQERLKALGLDADASYASPERIKKEIEFADKIMAKIGCPRIDVSNKAVEEIATKIIEIIRKGEK